MVEGIPGNAPVNSAPVATDDAVICFYHGDSLPCLAVRWDTRRAGQKWNDVPAHCAVILPTQAGPVLFEMIATGYHCRPSVAADYAWARAIRLPKLPNTLTEARRARGVRYSWATIALIALYRLLPDRWLSWIKMRDEHICSVYGRDVLAAGGWKQPGWLARQYCPCTPNDLWHAVQENTQ